eukprot:TRINITY_DN15624_c0_g1_i1.p1 TRINITY_DN15624_c0_g1~~TRINITY_DN15624_c0_g1_i1.p1  ORF type:complete len:578 (+),score=107.44 TRINITY_DN15624_c0_g1_i1:49-1734(+)
MSLILVYALGVMTGLLMVVAVVAYGYWIAKAKGTATLEEDRATIRKMKEDGVASRGVHTDRISGEWKSGKCKAVCEAIAGDSQVLEMDVELKAALPMLFIMDMQGERLATVLLEACQCYLVKTAGKKKLRHRWHKQNYLTITSTDSTKPVSEINDTMLTSISLYFPISRELERWFSILQQGTGFQRPTYSIGTQWRDALSAMKVSDASPTKAEEVVNVFLGRLLYQWQQRDAFKDYIKRKIDRQLKKVDPPSAIKGEIRVADLEVGTSLPVFSNTEIIGNGGGGDVTAEVDVRYTNGAFSVTLELDFDIASIVSLPRVLVTIAVKTLEGRLRFEISSVSDYMWLAFATEPTVSVSVTTSTPDVPFNLLQKTEIPELTDLVLTFLRSEVIQLMVLPNLEDIYIPLIDEKEAEDLTWVTTENAKRPKPLSATPCSSPATTTVNTKNLFVGVSSPSGSPDLQPNVEVAPPQDEISDTMGGAAEVLRGLVDFGERILTSDTPPTAPSFPQAESSPTDEGVVGEIRTESSPTDEGAAVSFPRKNSVKPGETIKISTKGLFSMKKKE